MMRSLFQFLSNAAFIGTGIALASGVGAPTLVLLILAIICRTAAALEECK